MDDRLHLLITVLYEGHNTLLRCAVCLDGDALSVEEYMYPMEPEHRSKIHGLLPLHIRSCGPVVEVKELFEVVDLTVKPAG